MKNLLQTTLIIWAIALCGLCAWQWHREVQTREQMTGLAQTNYDLTCAIQGYTNSLANMDRQIAQMDGRLTELREIMKSNHTVIVTLRAENARLADELGQYSNAVVTLQAEIKLDNEGIQRQNETVRNLVKERDEFVQRLNQSTRERNEIVTRYNDLVKQVEAQQKAQPKK